MMNYTCPVCGREPQGYPSCMQPRRAVFLFWYARVNFSALNLLFCGLWNSEILKRWKIEDADQKMVKVDSIKSPKVWIWISRDCTTWALPKIVVYPTLLKSGLPSSLPLSNNDRVFPSPLPLANPSWDWCPGKWLPLASTPSGSDYRKINIQGSVWPHKHFGPHGVRDFIISQAHIVSNFLVWSIAPWQSSVMDSGSFGFGSAA